MSAIFVPRGFLFAGMSAGIKKSGKNDLGLVVSEKPLNAVCYFTSNSFKAAPLLDSIAKLKRTKSLISAILVNSGNANCFTGKTGAAAVKKECASLARQLGVKDELVHASSTGIIKKPLPVEKIIKAIPELVAKLGPDNLEVFNSAIMTTDTFPKIESKCITIGGKRVTICGVAKGAGMIWPQVKFQATMLSYVFSDVNIAKNILQKITKEIIEKTFNSVTVDGCTSTNDSVFFLTSAKAGSKTITREDKDCKLFKEALAAVCLNLAQKIARDGKGCEFAGTGQRGGFSHCQLFFI